MIRMRSAVLMSTLSLLMAQPVAAQDILDANVTFVTSSGHWEDAGDPRTASGTSSGTDVPQKGYYKLIAVRQSDGTAHIVLQQIALDPSGPHIVSSAELEEFTRMKAFVTDIRPESSDGVTQQPGLFATVYLRTDPSAPDVETWTVLIDDLGDIKIERETN